MGSLIFGRCSTAHTRTDPGTPIVPINHTIRAHTNFLFLIQIPTCSTSFFFFFFLNISLFSSCRGVLFIQDSILWAVWPSDERDFYTSAGKSALYCSPGLTDPVAALSCCLACVCEVQSAPWKTSARRPADGLFQRGLRYYNAISIDG